MTKTQFEGNSAVSEIQPSSTPGQKIFCDYRLDDESLALLRDGVAPHQVLFPRKAAASMLENPEPDPAFLEADIAFGKPDVKSILESSRLRWVQITSAGYTRYDTPEFRSAAQTRGLRLTNSSSVFAEACAEHVFAFMLAQARQLPLALRTRVDHSSGDWAKLRNACSCLRGQSVVILGFGTIAARLVELLAPFQMKISVMRRAPRGDEPVATFVPDDLRSNLTPADHVVNILPDNADSRGFVSAERLACSDTTSFRLPSPTGSASTWRLRILHFRISRSSWPPSTCPSRRTTDEWRKPEGIMSRWVLRGLKTGIVTTRYPAEPEKAPGCTPGLPMGDKVDIILSGDSYDDAVTAAQKDVRLSGSPYVHAYDDLSVMAGQGTLADEVVLSGHGPFDVAYLQMGGGGMAAAVANWLTTYWPKIEIVGVEGVGQASMKAALEAGRPVALKELDIFCDGTAVRTAGTLPFQICQQVLTNIELVTNAEVGSAIRVLWETLRCIAEHSGAMGLAAVLKNRAALAGKRVLVVISGANIDFLQLGLIAQSEGGDDAQARSLRIQIPEQAGTMLALLDSCFAGADVIEIQYGKNNESSAAPILTISSDQPGVLEALPARLDAAGYRWEDVTGSVDVLFRAIPLRTDLLTCPAFLRLDFYERPGALHDFLDRQIRSRANICYFNYRHSGERIGRALIGFDFSSEAERTSIMQSIPEHGEGYRSCKPVDASTLERLCP
jgi:threonine dehydratase